MDLKNLPEVEQYLDDSDTYENTATIVTRGDIDYLLVTQKGAIDSGQLLFEKRDGQYAPVAADTVIEGQATIAKLPGVCTAFSSSDHQLLYEYVVSQVNVFSSIEGPDHGNLACLWTVRKLVQKALGKWPTKTDGTYEFGKELSACYGALDEADAPAGALIISPTIYEAGGRRRIGHVGFLGTGTGAARKIYSNSSANARLEQNFTLAGWIARYRESKRLKVLYYRVPFYQQGAAA